MGPTSTTVTSATATVYKVTEIWFVYNIELIMIRIILAIIFYRLFKAIRQIRNCPQKGCQFAIEIVDKLQKSLIISLNTFPGLIMNYHICSDRLIERMEVAGVIRPYLNIRWNVKSFNLNQINSCSTLKGRYPLSYILAHRLRKVLAQQFLPGCYPVIMHQNLLYYVKLVCDTPHGDCKFINPLPSGKGKEKCKKQANK